MKKVGIAFAMAMAALMIVVSPALAWGGNVDVDCSDVGVTDDSPAVGTTITFSGTVTITATADASGCNPMTYAYSAAGYTIYDPNGVPIYSDDQYLDDFDWDYCYPYAYADSDASQVYSWSQDVYIDLVGEYYAIHGGYAYATSGYWRSSHYYPYSPVYYPVYSDADSCDASKTVTSHGGAGVGAVASPPRLTIQLPADLIVERPLHAEHFFGSDGWGDPTSKFIVYNDGIWQVEIDDGTVIQLDGKWRKYTWIEVDDQGNVTARYGESGNTTAEEIGLSSPITITKVG